MGLIANPASARDIRRLVADGSAITTSQKLNVLRRLLSGLASGGVDHVISMTDGSGLSGGLATLANRPARSGVPVIEFLDLEVTRTAADTTAAVEAMVSCDVEVIVVLGGDGTNRVVAASCGDIPLASISTGTNNAFPSTIEPTVIGLAAALVAGGRIDRSAVVQQSKVLTVRCDSREELALVDVAVIDSDRLASGAIWEAASIRELFLCFAEPQAIGLSSIGAHVRPVWRHAPVGLHLTLGRPGGHRVRAPMGPGLVEDVDVTTVVDLVPGRPIRIGARSGVIAVDGERLFRIRPDDPPIVTLRNDGPRAIDIARTMHLAATSGLLSTPNLTTPEGGSNE